MTTSRAFNVRGRKVVTHSIRRFVVINIRPEDVTVVEGDQQHRVFGREVGTYVAFAEIIKRSDSVATARAFARRQHGTNRGVGVATVVVDTTTGEEV